MPSDRAYTIGEIDALREAVQTHFLYGVYDSGRLRGSSFLGRQYRRTELDNHVEQRVRTLMLAGLTRDDLVSGEASHAE